MKKNKFKDTINNLINNKIIRIMLILAFSLSISLLSVYIMIENPTKKFKIITISISFITSLIYLFKNSDNIISSIKNNKISSIVFLIISAIIFYEMIATKTAVVISSRIRHIKPLILLSFPGLALIITLVLIKIKEWLKEFINSMDSFEKKSYIITSIVMLIVVTVLYLRTNKLSLLYDRIFSLDSKFVYDEVLPNIYYYDIRHPLMSIITFPVYAIVDFIFSVPLKRIIFQLINTQLLILTGLELRRMTKNNFVYIFYIMSYSSVLLTIFMEKYILCTFLIVTYLYNILYLEKSSNKLITFIAGTMPTNLYIAVSELFRKIKFKEKIINILKIGLTSLLLVVILGRVHCFYNGYDEIKYKKEKFGKDEYKLSEKINSTTQMIETVFIPIKSEKKDNTYLWKSVTDKISYIGVGILIVISFGLKEIFKNKNKIYYSFLISLLFSAVLFIVLNWSVHESPLFNICFSWAIIPLFLKGIERLLNLLKIKTQYNKYIYITMLIIITILNINELSNIYNFIKTI